MKLLSISDTTTLKELSDMVGYNNVTDVLVANGLTRSPNIGEQFAQKVRAGLLAGPKAFLSEMMKNMAA